MKARICLLAALALASAACGPKDYQVANRPTPSPAGLVSSGPAATVISVDDATAAKQFAGLTFRPQVQRHDSLPRQRAGVLVGRGKDR
ncbi:MAG: hypothetical protein ACT4QG_04900 [Sporichthyaceae bacterium]